MENIPKIWKMAKDGVYQTYFMILWKWNASGNVNGVTLPSLRYFNSFPAIVEGGRGAADWPLGSANTHLNAQLKRESIEDFSNKVLPSFWKPSFSINVQDVQILSGDYFQPSWIDALPRYHCIMMRVDVAFYPVSCFALRRVVDSGGWWFTAYF